MQSRVCVKCNKFLTTDEAKCSICGEPLISTKGYLITLCIIVCVFFLGAFFVFKPNKERAPISTRVTISALGAEHLPKDAQIEADALITGTTLNDVEWKVSLIDPAVGLIRGHGWTCDTISAVQPLLVSKGFIIRCNRFSYVYEIEDKGGRWVVSLK